MELVSEYILAVNPFIKRMPADLREEYKKDLIREIAKQKIIFNKNNNKEDDYSILSRYYVFIVYLRKPSAKWHFYHRRYRDSMIQLSIYILSTNDKVA